MQDSILFWNAVALEANRVSHSDPAKRQQNGPTLSSRAIAIVHLAMYDAFVGIFGGGLPRYLDPAATPPPAPPPPPASARDAVAGAAYRTLSRLYSEQVDFFKAQLSCFNAGSTSFQFGELVGQTLLDLRANDMDGRSCGYVSSNKRGRHRLDPDNPGQGFDSVFYGAQTRTFAVKRRHTVDRPPLDTADRPPLDRVKYRRALLDVRARGIRPDLTGTLPNALFNRRRTSENTLVGTFWAYDGANRLGTPPRFYNQIIREVAMNVINPATGGINGEAENARLFAFVNAALADAGILAWEQKYCHDFWRPVVGIREHDRTLGPAAPLTVATAFADGDPGWLPLGAPSTNSTGMKNFTPNFPAYPSGHATLGAAVFHVTRMFYGIGKNNKSNDNLFPGFVVSDELNGGNRDNDGTVRPRHTRFFPGGLWQMIMENAISRIFLGVHWIFDAFDFTGGDNGPLNPSLNNESIGGVGLGLRIARDIFAHGNNGQGPQMTPPNVLPPIITPPANPKAPMPRHPAQPAEVGGCAGPAMDPPTSRAAATTAAKKRGAKGSGKKRAAKVSGKRAAGEGAVAAEISEQDQQPWPSGISEQDQDQPGSAQGAWPSGISEK